MTVVVPFLYGGRESFSDFPRKGTDAGNCDATQQNYRRRASCQASPVREDEKIIRSAQHDKTKDENADGETPPLRQRQTRRNKPKLPPPHSAAKRGRQSEQAFELALTRHRTNPPPTASQQTPPAKRPFGHFLAL